MGSPNETMLLKGEQAKARTFQFTISQCVTGSLMIPSIFTAQFYRNGNFVPPISHSWGATYIKSGEQIDLHWHHLYFRYITLFQNQSTQNWIEVEKWSPNFALFTPPVKISRGVGKIMSQWTFQAQHRTQSLLYFWHGEPAWARKFNTFCQPKLLGMKKKPSPYFSRDRATE